MPGGIGERGAPALMAKDNQDVTRRKFLTESSEIGLGSVLTASLGAAQQTRGDERTGRPTPQPSAGNSKKQMPMRKLGGTGVEVSILGVGGGGRGRNPQIRGTSERPEIREKAEQILHRALDLGINYIDTCAGYGASESIIGDVAAARRKEMFLATKCDKCHVSGDQLRRELEQSLKRLQTEQIDLWQIHNIATLQQVETIFKKDRAIEVFQKAKEQGAVRFIGITVHTSRKVIEEVLSRCKDSGIEMDTLLMTFNVADQASGGHGKQILNGHRSIGKIAMKVFASDGAAIIHQQKFSAETALRYVLSHGFATAIVGTHTLEELEENVRIVRDFQVCSKEELGEIEQQVVRTNGRPLWTLTRR